MHQQNDLIQFLEFLSFLPLDIIIVQNNMNFYINSECFYGKYIFYSKDFSKVLQQSLIHGNTYYDITVVVSLQ